MQAAKISRRTECHRKDRRRRKNIGYSKAMPDRRRHILIVEDAVDSLELFTLMLADDFEVTGCTSCTEALSASRARRPELVLMDIAIPEIDGFDCLKHLRALPGMDQLPAVAVTAFAYPADRARCLEQGFQAFVEKPVRDYAELRSLIQGLLGKR